MTVWLAFWVGGLFGVFAGVAGMCIFVIAGRASADMDRLIDIVPRNTRPPRLPRVD